MTRRKKVFIGLAGFSLVILVALNNIATMFIDSEWARNKIQTIISQNFDGNVDCQSIELSILPFPHAEIHQINISLPEKAQGTIQTFVITPKILSLFKGNFLIEKIRLESPNIKIISIRNHDKSDKPKETLTSDMINNTVASLLSPLVGKLPVLKVLINNGKVDFVKSDENIVALRDAHIELRCISENIDIKMNCSSNLCKEISANGSFDQREEKGNCEIRLSQIEPHTLIDRFLSNPAFRFEKPIDKLILRFKFDEHNDLKVKLKGSPLYLTVDINEIKANADYDNVPYPLQINEWEALYDGSKINVMNLSGTFGNSSFNGLNAGMGLEKDSRVEIQAESFLVSLDEIYPWISSFEKMSKALKDVKTVNGSLELTPLNLDGLFAMPEEWHIKTTGIVKDLAVDTAMLPEPVVVKEGHFELSDNKFSLTDTKVSVSDIPLDHPEYFTAQGTFEGKDFSIPWHKNVPLTINSVSLLGKGKSVEVDSIMLTWGGKNISLDGDINTSDEGIAFDMDMFASLLDWEVIRETLGIGDKEKNVNEDGSGVSGSKDGYFWEFPINGVLRLHSKCFTYEQFTSNPLQANIVFNHDSIVVTITDSDLCGFFLPGELTVTPKYMLLDFQLLGSDQELKAIIDCMGDKERLMTGSLDIDAQVVALGETKDIGKTLQGDFKITAKNGRIYKGTLFAKLLAFLNFTEIFRGRIPDLAKKGFAYRSITMNGTVHNGTMIFDEVIIDGSSLGITGNGNMDLVNNRIDLNLLVSPLKTVDSIIKKTPVVGKILGGTLVAVPVGVKGDTKNPKISDSFLTTACNVSPF